MLLLLDDIIVWGILLNAKSDGELCCVAENGDEGVGMPFDGGEGERGYGFGDAVHGGGGPVEQLCEYGIDGWQPQECPPKYAAPHEQIDEGENGEVADDGKDGDVAEVMRNKRCGKEGTDEGDAHGGP